MGSFQNAFLLAVIGLSFSAHAHTGAGVVVQYFDGIIQPSSLDQQTPYGPPYNSLVRRTVDRDGFIQECTLQQGEMIYTVITKTKVPLVYLAQDADHSFSGTITFSDETLSAWSYDIRVYVPNKGHITGALPDYGAQIDSQSGALSIKKIWNDRVLLTEEYVAIHADEFVQRLADEKVKNPSMVVPSECQVQ